MQELRVSPQDRETASTRRSDGLAQSIAGCALAAAGVYLAINSGPIYPTLWPYVLMGVLPGLAAGLASRTRFAGVSGALLGLAVGMAIERPVPAFAAPWMYAVAAVTAALSGWAFEQLLERRILRPAVVGALGLALILAHTWLTCTILLGTAPAGGVSQSRVLATRPAANTAQTDSEFYRAVVFKVRDGEGFYDAFRESYHENAAWTFDPQSVLSVRLPWLTYLWARLPSGPGSMPALLIALATAAAIGVYAVGATARQPAAGLVGASFLLAYAMYFVVNEYIMFAEIWSGLLGVLMCAFVAASSSGAAIWTGLAATTALLAAASRELMIAAPLAGTLAEFGGPQRPRRLDRWLWLGALFASAALLAAHFARANRIVDPNIGLSTWVERLSWHDLWNAGWWGTYFAFPNRPVAVVFASVMFLAILGIRERRLRTASHTLTGMLVLVFASVGNAAIAANGTRFNYWGGLALPVVLALGPLGVAHALGSWDEVRARFRGGGIASYPFVARLAVLVFAGTAAALVAGPSHPAVIGLAAGTLSALALRSRTTAAVVAIVFGFGLATGLATATGATAPDAWLTALWAAVAAIHLARTRPDETPVGSVKGTG